MILELDPNNPTPLYQQIYTLIIEGIARGHLKEGQQLPSVRQLGVDLGVNLHTANKAYQLLRDEGYLTLSARDGAVIDTSGLDKLRFQAHLEEELKELSAQSIVHKISPEDFAKAALAAYKKLCN